MKTIKRDGAFTLIELLVVVAIIGILAIMVLGGAAKVKHRSKITVCQNNCRQWGIAANLYAVDDGKGRLPAFEMPLTGFSKYRDLMPHFVAISMASNMSPYGIQPILWFCPVRDGKANADKFFSSLSNASKITTIDDLTLFWSKNSKGFGISEYCWWVPRKVWSGGEVFPDVAHITASEETAWPRSVQDPRAANEPIMTDSLLLSRNDRGGYSVSGDGHPFGRLSFSSINLLYADGHIVLRPNVATKWRIELTGGFAIGY